MVPRQGADMKAIDEKILSLFRKRPDDFLSGEEISRSLGVSRAAIWKHMENLRQIGYRIDAQPHLGYKLVDVPDKLLPDEIKRELKTKIFGKEIYSYEKVDSTNDIAYRLAEEGCSGGAIVLADEQVKGKGRLGRSWSSPPGSGVYLSCIIRPDILPNEVSKITLVAALACANTIRNISGLEAMIKWPNDILLSSKKVCGILTEMKAELDRVDFAVLGMGINVNTGKGALPEGATSIKEELGQGISRIEFTKKLIEEFEKTYTIFTEKGFDRIRKSVKEMSFTLGKYIKVISHSKTFEGHAQDIDEAGALILRLDSGISNRILSGDVTHVR
jgi:BirA family transcriptional regulator, biotin operon repressor / biotin---[acetyl-CoA-carboxylase] ligase